MRRFHFAVLALSAALLGCWSGLHPFYELAITPPDAGRTPHDSATEPPDVAVAPDGGFVEDVAHAQDSAIVTDAAPVADGEVASDVPPGDAGDTPDTAEVSADAAPTDASEPPHDAILCPAGFTGCGAACVDTSTSAAHCGACGHACSGDHATSMCLSGACVVVRCAEGYADCDGNPANGCEVSLTSPEHCAVCTNACAPRPGTAPSCATGSCAWTCLAGRADCDGNPANGCEVSTADDRANCGACGHRCGFGMLCTAGACVVDPSFQPVAPCLHESDYVRGTSIAVAVGGYSPRCLRVAIGATVTFNGALDEHPVLGFMGATTPNPITYLSAPPARSVAFTSAGFFPFGCTLHETERGVVWVE